MPLFGILKGGAVENTGLDSELSAVFSTPLTITSNQPVLAADTLSLRRKTMGQRAQRWEITANICPTVGSNEYLLHSVFHGHEKTFQVRMPQIPKSPYSNAALTIAAAFTKGETILSYDRETTGDLIAGEFICFSNRKKVYLVMAVDTENQEFEIFPPLIENMDVGETIYHGDKVTLYAKAETSTGLGMTFIDGLLMDPGTITLIEDVNIWNIEL